MKTGPKQLTSRLGSPWLLIAVLVALVVIPLASRSGSDFSGTDNAALGIITEVNPDAKPWIRPLWVPPGKEIESFLFALQAALGAGAIGYFFGLKRGERRAAEVTYQKRREAQGGSESPAIEENKPLHASFADSSLELPEASAHDA